MPRKNVPPHADFGRALQQLRAARGVTQEDMLSTTTRAQQVADAPLPATSHAGALLRDAEALEAISTLLARVNRRGFW
jgi:transcriptional regulator with XRE-family HTH domain